MYISSALKRTLQEAGSGKLANDFDANAVTQFVSTKLFKNIENKSDHDLIREAMKTKGQIEKMPNYNEFIESIKVLQMRSLEQNAVNTKRILELFIKVRDTLQSNTKQFQDAFKTGDMESKAIQLTYASVVSALFISNSILIANVVDYVNDPVAIKKIMINDGRAADLESSLPIERLRKFLNISNDVKFKKFLNEATLFENECLNEYVGVIAAVAGTVVIGVALLSFVRDIVDFIFSSRQKASSWLKIQGNLLKMNAIKQNPNGNVRKKQEEYSEVFYTLANKIKIESQYAEKSAMKEIKDSDNEIERGVQQINTDDQFKTGSGSLI